MTEEWKASFPVRKDSIEELVGHRDHALRLAEQALRTLVEAEETARRACPSELYGCGILSAWNWRGLSWEPSHRKESIADQLETARKSIDGSAWRSLQKISGLRNLMDHKAHEAFDEQLKKSPPLFTTENIIATFMGMASQAPEIFERSVVNVFESLNTRRYKTNSAFKVGSRAILTGAMSPCKWGSGWNHYGRSQNLVGDMDRLFHVLDRKRPPETGNASDVVGFQHAKGEKTCETTYMSFRMFRGNGNLHIKFLRPDLVDRINDILARHYGVVLPDDRKAA